MPDHISSGTHTVLGFDFGTKKTGVAVGQTITGTASVLEQLEIKNGEPDWLEVDKLIKIWQPFALVIGLPLNMDGTVQPITQKVEKFVSLLQSRYNLPVHKIDERLSTIEARAQLFEKGGYKALSKKNIDMQSAQIILQAWLNGRQIND